MPALFAPTEIQAQLVQALERWLAEAWPFEKRAGRLAQPEGVLPLWQGLAELGLLGAALPEALGGLGEAEGGLAVQLLILHSLGPALASEPYLGSALIGAGLLQRCGGVLAQRHLPGVADGSCRIALAALEPHSRHHLDQVHTRLLPQAEGFKLDGRKTGVAGAPGASHLIASARDDAGQFALLWLPADAPGVQQRPLRTVDGQWAAELGLDGVAVPAEAVLARGDAALALLQQAIDEATLATGAEAVAIGQKLLDDSVAYAQQRQQFGVPIASFQALQHRLADMHCALIQARALVAATLAEMAGTAQQRAKAVASAQLAVARACRCVGQGAVQIHGAMGMTDELWIGHGFKRLTMIERQFGSEEAQLQRYAQSLELA